MSGCRALWPGVNPASAIFPGIGLEKAVAMANELMVRDTGEPAEHMQLCPQHPNRMTWELVDRLLASHPDTRFRLHASVRPEGLTPCTAATSWEDPNTARYFARLAELSLRMGATGYALHAGDRGEAPSIKSLASNLKRIQALFGAIPVIVEGLYNPARQFISTWDEYQWLIDSGLAYAVDLSHLNIVSTREGRRDWFVAELLGSPCCLEVHVSGNDGRHDSHAIADDMVWWRPLLLAYRNAEAVVFDEGIRARIRSGSMTVM